MLVRNEATGHTIKVEDHAMQRWGELHGHTTDDIAVSLGRAIPFGGQVGEGEMLLLDGEVAFAVKLGNAKVVRTVLTKAMAVANMQNFIGSARKAAYAEVVKAPAGAVATKMPNHQEAELICKLNERAQATKRLKQLTDEQLETERQEVIVQHQQSYGRLAKAYGRLRNTLDLEKSRRGLTKKRSGLPHETLEQIEHASTKRALRELLAEGFLSEELLALIYKRAETIREQLREEAKCKLSA